MKTRCPLILSYIIFFLSGCASFQAGTNVESGRKAFLIGNNEAALGFSERSPDRPQLRLRYCAEGEHLELRGKK